MTNSNSSTRDPLLRSEITYGELFQHFKADCPTLDVEDYRPSMLPYAITVWLKDGRKLIYHYDPMYGGAIVGSNIVPE